LRQAQRFVRASTWVYKGDISAYFASVPHAGVMAELRRRVHDDAICDRLLHNAHRIELKGPTIRNTKTPPKTTRKDKS